MRSSIVGYTAPANSKAIRGQLWAVYTLEYKRGVRNCWIDALASTDASPAVIGSTFDAIVQSHMAFTDEQDPLLMFHARNAYGRALATLTRSVSALPASLTTNRHNARGILIGMLLVGLCQPGASDDTRQASWMVHYEASQRFVKTLGAGIFDTNDDLDMQLLQVTWFLNFLSCLALRKRMTLDLPTWDSFAVPMCEGSRKDVFGFLRSWYQMILPIPHHLEEADAMLAKGGQPEADLRCTVQSLFDFSENVNSWIAANIMPTVIHTTAEDLIMTIEEHCFLLINTTFPKQYHFPRQEMAMLWLVTWFTRLIADCTVLRAVLARPHRFTGHSDLSPSNLHHNANLAATNLARSIFSVSKLPSVTYATILGAVLDVLATFFAGRGSMQELGWCEACKLATDLRLQRLQKLRPRTLCRIQDVAPRLIAAVAGPFESCELPALLRGEEKGSSQCPFGNDGAP